MDHARAPVLEALTAFRQRGDVVYGPPGHKQGRGVDPRVLRIVGADVFASDVLTLNGLDDRRESHKVMQQAQELMADAVRAEHAFFSTCGSSLSVKTAIMSVAGPGEKLLVARNAHKSIISGLIIGGIRPVWIPARFDADLLLTHPPGAEEVEACLAEHPDAKGVFLVSPTDWGSCADLAAVAKVCHAAGVPFLVDEAWGAHLPFHPDLPAWGMDAGADLVVTSVHKMGAAVEQSSVFHLQGDLIDPSVLKAREDLLGTTSSSSLVYATLDGWRRQMVEHGRELLGRTLAHAARVRDAIEALPGLDLMGRQAVRPGGAADLDPLRITVDVRQLGLTGYQVGDWLRAECHVDIGSADACRISGQLSIGDDDFTVDRLIAALERLVAEHDRLEPAPPVRIPDPTAFGTEPAASVASSPAASGRLASSPAASGRLASSPAASGRLASSPAMRPRDAFFGPAEQVPAAAAVGRICAEMLSPYPPGVPVLLPGEVVTRAALDYLTDGVAAGMLVPDATDPSLETLRVVARP